MHHDLHGLALTASSQKSAAAFDRAVMGYVKFRADTPSYVAATIENDPECFLAHCLQGYLAMISFKLANVPVARAAAERARAQAAHAWERERAHLAALEAWIADGLDRSLTIWEQILADYPADILAFRVAHHVNFWLGRPRAMRLSAERIVPKWDRTLPGYGTVLSCLCFATEECGDYAAAEPAGWDAIELDPADFWAHMRSRM
ncbi:MAG: hypothetical protein QOD74_564 [Variibacter sp.]|nr:hypothetical protein [Variibacter sp.]